MAVAVDETHCVCKWGNEFHVAFARIRDLRSILPSHVHMLALTATATHKTLQVVSQLLSLKDVVVVALSPSRPNIMYKVRPLEKLEDFSISLSSGL